MSRPDLTQKYNTPLSPQEEARFQTWAKAHNRQADTFDYDLRGAWKADAKAASNGHLPDTWKKPNHPTFSDESQYSNAQMPGGQWVEGKKGKWQFKASDWNIRNLGVKGLQQYFQQVEPDAALILPLANRLYPNDGGQ